MDKPPSLQLVEVKPSKVKNVGEYEPSIFLLFFYLFIFCFCQVKVMKYQDEVEAGKRSRKSDMTLQEQVEYYRKKLLNKVSKKTEVNN